VKRGIETVKLADRGRKNQKYFRFLLQIEKLHLPLHPGSQGTENRNRKQTKKEGKASDSTSRPNEAGQVL
jgi:hypothetical protein